MTIIDQSNWTILYTDHQKKFIHADHLYKSNQEAQIILVDISNNYHKNYAWRNSDKIIRKWIQNNISLIHNNKIAILEWDVLVTTKLPDINPEGLIAKDVQIYSSKNTWNWFKEIKFLTPKYKPYALGISPMSVLFMNKTTLHYWISNQCDDIYNQDLFCELRLPTLLNSQKILVSNFNLPNVSDRCIQYSSTPSIYHAIKQKSLL